MTTICTVFKTGGDFKPEHVQALHRQFGKHKSICLTDYGEISGVKTKPLTKNWRGWWAKLNLFNPSLVRGDILYMDLDTVITGSIEHYMNLDQFTMLSDFYHPHKPASGMMFIPQNCKKHIWMEFCTNANEWIQHYRGDQDFLEALLGQSVARFGDDVKSYKVHVAKCSTRGFTRTKSQGNGKVPPGTNVLCFHGKPRPFEIDIQQIL